MHTLPLILSFLVTISAADETIRKSPLHLLVGEQRSVWVEGLEKYSVGSPILKAVRKGNHQLMLKAVSTGQTDLWVWKKDGQVEIRTIVLDAPSESGKQSPWSDTLIRLLGDLREVDVVFGDKSVLLEGKVTQWAELKRIERLKALFADLLSLRIEPSAEILNKAETGLQDWLERSAPHHLRLERRNQTLWIRGWVENPQEAQNYQKQARVHYPMVDWDVGHLPDAHPTAYFRIYLLEIRKNQFEQLGLNTRPRPEQAGLQILQLFSGLRVLDTSALDTTIDLMSIRGDARILSKPELVVRIPGKAELFAGGEYPITNEGRFFSQTVWKTHGLELQLNATHDGGDRVRVEIKTQWSQLGQKAEGQKIPTIQSNRMQTQVDAYFGRPLLLCGLIEDHQRQSVVGIPGLKDIPIIGKLFGSEEWKQDRSELVAVILPNRTPPEAIHHATGFQALGEEFVDYPKGPVPVPRSRGRQESTTQLKAHPDFPWNVFGQLPNQELSKDQYD